MTDLDAIKRRLAAATSGPWQQWTCREAHPESRETHGPHCRGVTIDGGSHTLPTQADDALVAHAPSDLDALVAEVERLRAENERLRTALDPFAREHHSAGGAYCPESRDWDLALETYADLVPEFRALVERLAAEEVES